MDFQLHAQSNKSILSFLSAFKALFSCTTCLSNKQDCTYSSQYSIYDQSLYTTCPVLAYYYFVKFGRSTSPFKFFSCTLSCLNKSKNVCMCETGYRNSATNMKVSIFIPDDINLICTKFGTFTVICAIVPKGWCFPLYYVYLMPV